MASRALLFSLLLLVLSCLAQTSYGEVILFSSLKQTLTVEAERSDASEGRMNAGEGKILVRWGLNKSFPAGTDSTYKTVKVKLCYAPVSQVDRPWRKTVADLSKDKTCTHKILSRPYNKTMDSIDWTVERDIPTASYFVRAYAFDAAGHEVAYGQNTGAGKDTNLLEVQAITGRHVTLDIVSVCFSAFSVVSLAGFFTLEKVRAKKSSKNAGN